MWQIPQEQLLAVGVATTSPRGGSGRGITPAITAAGLPAGLWKGATRFIHFALDRSRKLTAKTMIGSIPSTFTNNNKIILILFCKLLCNYVRCWTIKNLKCICSGRQFFRPFILCQIVFIVHNIRYVTKCQKVDRNSVSIRKNHLESKRLYIIL